MTNLSGTNLNNGAAVGPQGECRESTSRFPKYPAYKDSGVEWLGSVPEHWAIFSLKRSVDGCTNGLWGDEPDGENDLAVIRVADFDRATCRVGLDKLTYRSITQKERASRLLQSGDLLIEKSGGGEKTLVGCVVLFEHEFEAITSNFVARMRPLASFDSGFLCYAFDSLYQGKVNFPAIKQTTGIQNLDSESYLQEQFCFPTLVEQTQIARFLDHETARIDALIEEQQRLIELLKEKRQAVISHAVTKGLDPTVPIKDSGVQWLGEVPAHWEVCALMNLTAPGRAIMYGIVLPGENVEDGIPIVKGGDVKPSRLVLDLLCRTTREIEASFARARLKPKDVVYSIRGTIGDAELVPDDFAHVNITQDVARISPREDIDSGWLLYVMRSKPVFVQLEQRSLGAAVRGINICDLKRAKIPVPPALERVRIAEFIRLEVSRLDELMLEASGGIGLLQERRSALISAAVTGKIDVRSWQPPVSTQAPESAAEAV